MSALPAWVTEPVPADQEVAHLRIPPHSMEAEQSVLGGLMLDASAWDRVGDLLVEADFYRHEHRLIFAAVSRLAIASKPIDSITVHERLEAAGQAPDVGGLPYLNALAQSVPSAANIRRYAEIVRERALLRKLVSASDDIATSAFNPKDKTVADVLAEAEALIIAVSAAGQRGNVGPQEARTVVLRRIDEISDMIQSGKPPGAPTGLDDLDVVLNGGMQDGRVYVLAARPSVGKSSLALQIALHRAKQGDPVLVLTQEMPAGEYMDRAICNEGGIDYGDLQKGNLDDTDWANLCSATDAIGKLPLWIDDQSDLTLRDIRAKAMAMRKKGLRLLVIDYLQLCNFEVKKGQMESSAIGAVSKGIKSLAKQLGIPIILLSQLNRDVEKRATPEPNLGDLRDSGAIEQDADAVWFLWQVRKLGRITIVGLGIAKNRQGEKGQRIPLEFRGYYQRWLSSEADITPDRKTARASGGID